MAIKSNIRVGDKVQVIVPKNPVKLHGMSASLVKQYSQNKEGFTVATDPDKNGFVTFTNKDTWYWHVSLLKKMEGQ